MSKGERRVWSWPSWGLPQGDSAELFQLVRSGGAPVHLGVPLFGTVTSGDAVGIVGFRVAGEAGEGAGSVVTRVRVVHEDGHAGGGTIPRVPAVIGVVRRFIQRIGADHRLILLVKAHFIAVQEQAVVRSNPRNVGRAEIAVSPSDPDPPRRSHAHRSTPRRARRWKHLCHELLQRWWWMKWLVVVLRFPVVRDPEETGKPPRRGPWQ